MTSAAPMQKPIIPAATTVRCPMILGGRVDFSCLQIWYPMKPTRRAAKTTNRAMTRADVQLDPFRQSSGQKVGS